MCFTLQLLDSVNNEGMKQIKGLDERLESLQQRLLLVKQLVQDQNDMAQVSLLYFRRSTFCLAFPHFLRMLAKSRPPKASLNLNVNLNISSLCSFRRNGIVYHNLRKGQQSIYQIKLFPKKSCVFSTVDTVNTPCHHCIAQNEINQEQIMVISLSKCAIGYNNIFFQNQQLKIFFGQMGPK